MYSINSNNNSINSTTYPYLELMRYCAIPTDSGVPDIVTSLSLPSPSLEAIFISAPELTLAYKLKYC